MKYHQLFPFIFIWVVNTSHAQITTDGSLGARTYVSVNASQPNYFEIPSNLGILRGSNLFHSFEEFNIDSGETAVFSGPDKIDNILSRVTGNTESCIDGTLKSSIPSANFYLLNPNGIVIGENANLDISGTFHASTAAGITLGEKEGYFSSEPNQLSSCLGSPTLCVAPPIAFGFLDSYSSKQGSITVSSFRDGSTYYAPKGKINIFPSSDEMDDNLIKNNTFLAPAGEIYLDAMNQDINFESPKFGVNIPLPRYVTAEIEKDINVGEDVKGIGPWISLEPSADGTRLVKVDYRVASLDTSVNPYFHEFGDSGAITIKKAKNLYLDATLISSSDYIDYAGGKNINIYVEEDMFIHNGADVSNRGGGNIKIEAQFLELSRESENSVALDLSNSAISTHVTTGNGGDIEIGVDNLLLSEASAILAIKDIGHQQEGSNITINATEEITLLKKSRINTSSLGSQQTGDITVNSKSLSLNDSFIGNVGSSINEPANNGNVTINSDKLTLRNFSEVTNFNRSSGDGGDLEINSNEITITDSKITTESGLGNGGKININAKGRIYLENSSVTTTSAQKAGDVHIVNEEFLILDKSNVFTRSLANKSGDNVQNGGDITIGTNAFVQSSENSVFAEAKYSVIATVDATTDVDGLVHTAADVSNSYETGRNYAEDYNVRVIDFLDNNKIIDSSSRDALDGTIRIEANYSDPIKGLVKTRLPERLLSLIPCENRRRKEGLDFWTRGSGFLNREAIPNMPDDWLSSGTKTYDLSLFPPTLANKVKEGLVAFDEGRFNKAIQKWDIVLENEVFHAFSTPELKKAKIDLLSHLADAYQHIGMYYSVFKMLDDAMVIAEKEGYTSRQIILLSQFSDAWLAIGYPIRAINMLIKDNIKIVRDNKNPILLNALGNAHAIQALTINKTIEELIRSEANAETLKKLQEIKSHYYEYALYYYNEGLETSEGVLNAKISVNKLKTLAINGEIGKDEAANNLKEQWQEYFGLTNNYGKATVLLAAAIFAEDTLLEKQCLHDCKANIKRAYKAIRGITTNPQTLSIAYGRLGKLNRDSSLFQRAIFFADGLNAFHLRYQWQHEQAKLYKAQQDNKTAKSFYRKAINQSLRPIQGILSIGYRDVPSFNEQIKSVYYELIALLAEEKNSKSQREIITLLDNLKVLELRGYFQDECFLNIETEQRPDLPYIAAKSAVIYPIIIKNSEASSQSKLLILVRINNEVHLFPYIINYDNFLKQASLFRRYIQSPISGKFVDPAQYLYKKLITPIKTLLAQHQITTLVFVPDSALYNIPFAGLYDNGGQFLIEKYAVAVTLNTSNTKQSSKLHNPKILLAGLSEGKYPLPHVEPELKAIEKLNPQNTNVLLNQDFTPESFEYALSTSNYNIVHIATHAAFGNNPDITSLLAYGDEKNYRPIRVDKLDQLISLKRPEHNVDLLTLSACETALGNERAGLGMAGIAYKAGARTLLASLWQVNDEATKELMSNFYANLLNNPKDINKAQILQNTQQKLLATPRFRHPAYWAAFSLIGEWQ